MRIPPSSVRCFLVEADVAKRFNSRTGARWIPGSGWVDTILAPPCWSPVSGRHCGLDAIGLRHYNRFIDPVLVSLLAPVPPSFPIKVLAATCGRC